MVANLSSTNWFSILQRLDTVVDERWSEPVEFHPWTGQGTTTAGHPDTTRPVIVTQGCYVTAGARAVGEIADGAVSQQVEQDVWASVTTQNLGPYASTWKTNDRVFWPDRDEWFQVTYIPPSATFRPNIHLLRLNEQALAVLPKASARFRDKVVLRMNRTKPHRRRLGM